MGVGDAYKPAGATPVKVEPERVIGNIDPIHCAHCGAEVKLGTPYVRKGDRVFHSAEPCKAAWVSYTPPKPAEAVLMEPPSIGRPGLVDKQREAIAAELGLPTDVVWPPSHDFGPGSAVRKAVEASIPGPVDLDLLKGPAERGEHGRMVGASRGEAIAAARRAAEADDPQLAQGLDLERLAAMLGLKREEYDNGERDVFETDVELRTRVLAAFEHKRRGALPPNAGAHVAPRKLRVYVAGASKEPLRCRAGMKSIERIGGEVTLDWLAAIEREGAANEGLDDEKRKRYALDDLRGCVSADLVWVLASPLATTGSWTELGIAIVARMFGHGSATIVVSGPARERSIFAALADFESDSDLEALAWIQERAKLGA